MRLIQNNRTNKDKLQRIDEISPEEDTQIYQAVCKCGLKTNMLINTMLSTTDFDICPECFSKLTFYKLED